MGKISILLLLLPDPVAGKKLTDLIGDSSAFAKIILFVLLAFSVISWAIMIYKFLEYKRVVASSAHFIKEFRRRRSLEKSFASLSQMKGTPYAGIFGVAFVELEALISANGGGTGRVTVDDDSLDHIAEAIDRAGVEAVTNLEKYIVFLATTANASPFLGLLGTVWGIMESFSQIGVMGTATLAVVAPGIAEALIATVAGLAAAIPAVIAYNYFTNKLRFITSGVDNFKSELYSAIKKELTTVAQV